MFCRFATASVSLPPRIGLFVYHSSTISRAGIWLAWRKNTSSLLAKNKMIEFQIKQENFEGPLELLLELIDKEKMDISKVSLAKVADEYLKHVKALDKINVENLAEFLVVAAQLMLIKSRSLLPDLAPDVEEEFSAEDLFRRLEEYRRIKELAKSLRMMESSRRIIFTREAYQNMDPVFHPPQKLEASSIKQIFEAFISSIPKIEKLAEEQLKRIVSLEDKINHIRKSLIDAVEKGFSEIIKGAKEKVDVIVSFLAILELAKEKFVDLKQEKLFEDIIVRKMQ